MKGVVTKYFPDKGFGFIKLEDGNLCYFHKSKITNEIERIYSGDTAEVEYRESRKKPGEYEAISLLISPSMKINKHNPKFDIQEKYALGYVKMINSDGGYGFITTDGYNDVFFSVKNLLNPSDIDSNRSVIISIIPSRRKIGSDEANSVIPVWSFRLSDYFPLHSDNFGNRSFNLCLLFLKQKSQGNGIDVDMDELSSFFKILTDEQKHIAFNLWLNAEIDFYDDNFLNEVYNSLGVRDKLRSISRSQMVSLDIAFDQLDKYHKEQLFNECLESSKSIDNEAIKSFIVDLHNRKSNSGGEKYFDLDYFRSKFELLTFVDALKIVISQGLDSSVLILLEFLEKSTQNEYAEAEFKVVMEFLDKAYSYDEDRVKALFISIHKNLSDSQKHIAFKLWLNGELDYYDETFLKEVYDSLDKYDKLMSISMSQKVSLGIAFDQLSEDVKDQLFDDSLELRKKLEMKEFWTSDSGRTLNIPDIKITGFFNLDYLRTKLARLKFIDIYSILIPEKSSVKKSVLIEYFLQTPHSEYSDEELDIVFDVLDNYYRLEKETIKSIYESIHDKLRYPQKQKMLDKFLSSKSELYDAGFLLSEINRFNYPERLVLAQKVDSNTRKKIFEGILNLMKEGLILATIELKELLKLIKKYDDNDVAVRIVEAILNMSTPEEKYDLWIEGLIDDIDQNWLMSNLSFNESQELSKVIKRIDSSHYDLIIEETLKNYPKITDQTKYDEVASALENLKQDYFLRTETRILDKYCDELYQRSSEEFKYRWFQDGFVSILKLNMIQEHVKTFDSTKFARFVKFLSPEERAEFSRIVVSLHIESQADVKYARVIDVINLFKEHYKLKYDVENKILTVVNDNIKLALAPFVLTQTLSDEMYRSRLEILLQHTSSFSIELNSYLVYSALYRSCTENIAVKFLSKSANFKGLLLATKTLLKEGFCYFERGNYEGVSVVDTWRRDRDYILFIIRRAPSMLKGINDLAQEGIKTIESVGARVSKFLYSEIIPQFETIHFKIDDFLPELDETLSIIDWIQKNTLYALESTDGLLLAIRKCLFRFIKLYHHRIQVEVLNTGSCDLLKKYGRDFYTLEDHFENEAKSSVYEDISKAIELSKTCSDEFMEGMQVQIERILVECRTYSECVGVLHNFIDLDHKSVIEQDWVKNIFYKSCNEIIISELQEYQIVNSYRKWLKLRKLINREKPRITFFLTHNICPYIEGLEKKRDQTIREFLSKSPIIGFTPRRYERCVALIGEINKSYDEPQAKELINLIHSYCDDEFQLKLWLYEYVSIFDFERYAMVYFTLTREERRNFNKRVREIIKDDLDKKLLAVRVPWKLVKKEGNETVYEATWRSVWFQDGAIRFCMDEGIFSAPYNLSFARKDFNSIYSFLSGKRGGDLTVYCVNDSIVDVQGLDELKELIQRVIITNGLTESNNFLFKSEGENRVPVNLLLKNECMNVLSKLVGEGIKVHRVYEKIWKVDHGIPVPFNFDISYIFPVPVTDGTYVLLWESARLEKSKATYVFNCPHDQLDEYLEKLIMFIDRKVNVRSAILESNIVQCDLGFRGRIEHENFDIFPWKKRLVSYLPGYSDKIFESTEAEQ